MRTGSRLRRSVSFLALFSATIILSPTLAAADETIEAGRADFERHCAVCHGINAAGNGPLASYLIRKPADLTILQKKAGGEFPGDLVSAAIDGRADVATHGPREMPVWGYRFRDTPDRNPEKGSADQRIRAITRYLESLQIK